MREKYNAIKLCPQSKLDSNADIISLAIRDGGNSSMEFHKVLKEVKKYRKSKADIRNQTKIKVSLIFSINLLNTFFESIGGNKTISKQNKGNKQKRKRSIQDIASISIKR